MNNFNNMNNTKGSVKSKIVLIGDYGSGKTSFIHRLVFNSFDREHIPTIGAAINEVCLDKNNYIFWDTAGQERYHALVRLYYRHCHCVLIFYNMNDQASRSNIVNWIDTLNSVADEAVPVVIIGSKSDIAGAQELDLNDAPIAEAISKINLVANITISNKLDSQDDIFKKLNCSLEKVTEFARSQLRPEEIPIIHESPGYFEYVINFFTGVLSTYCNIA